MLGKYYKNDMFHIKLGKKPIENHSVRNIG